MYEQYHECTNVCSPHFLFTTQMQSAVRLTTSDHGTSFVYFRVRFRLGFVLFGFVPPGSARLGSVIQVVWGKESSVEWNGVRDGVRDGTRTRTGRDGTDMKQRVKEELEKEMLGDERRKMGWDEDKNGDQEWLAIRVLGTRLENVGRETENLGLGKRTGTGTKSG